MKVAICDDEEVALLSLEKCIRKEFLNARVPVELVLFQSALELRHSIFAKEHYDVLFLDIDMPEVDGIDLAVQIHEFNPDEILIFISNMEGSVFRSFQAHPFSFIRKSEISKELPKTITSILCKQNSDSPSILIETAHQTLRLNPISIQYIECNRKILNIFTESGTYHIIFKISDMEQLLKNYGFIRIHKGYLVNYRYILSINKEDLTMDDQTVLPVSRGRIQEVRHEFRRLTI